MARIGILGASGYLGNEVYLRLKESTKHKTIGFSRSDMNLVSFDYADMDTLAGFDIIVNCAGPSFSECEQNNLLALDYYDTFQSKLLEFCLDNNISLISLSTLHIYKKTEGLITEDSEVEGDNAYTKYRLNFESRVTNCGSKKIALLRLGNGFGKSFSKSSEGSTLFINSIAQAIKIKQEFEVNSEVDFCRNYVPISYISEFIVKLLDLSCFPATVVNVVSNKSKYASEIINTMSAFVPDNSIKYKFKKQAKFLDVSNKLCSSILPYKEEYFSLEIERLLA